MNDSSSELEKKALVETLKEVGNGFDNPRICKPCCSASAGTSQQTQNGGSVTSTEALCCKSRPAATPKENPPFERGDAKPACPRPQPPPPPMGGTAVIIPLATPHRKGRPVPLIVEPDYVRRENPEKYIVALPEPTRVRSRELIASHMYHGCQCGKRNGLQDHCRRWDCRGFPYCCANGLCKPSGGLGCDGTQCRKG